jgi:hypothetical protein
MKKILAVTAALAFALSALAVATPADAKFAFNSARYKACWKKVMPQRSYGPGALAAVDMCYRGLPW